MLNRRGQQVAKISPSILSADFGRLREEVEMVTRSGADSLHIDVMDGHFVPNITMGPVVIRSIRGASSLPFETHLMIEHPDRLLKDFAESGSDLLIVHPEAHHDLPSTLESIRGMGKLRGVAVNPETPLSAVGGVMGEVEMLLIMTVHPGFGGQKFIEAVLPKIREARKLVDEAGLRTRIVIDGGVNLENGKQCMEAGAHELVAGTSVFRSQSPADTIRKFREL